jgi:hypothetical protein
MLDNKFLNLFIGDIKLKKVILIIFLSGLVMVFRCSHEKLSTQTTFERTYGDIHDEGGSAVQQTSDGGYIIAGYTHSFGSGKSDVYLIKTDADGDTLWTRTYGGIDYDFGYHVQQVADSGYIIVGSTRSFGAGGEDVYLIKTDAKGNTLWTKTFGGSSDDWGYCVQQTSDTGYIIVGYTDSFGAGPSDVYLIKTDADGDTLWTRTYGGSNHDGGLFVQQTSDGGYIITGLSRSFNVGLTFPVNDVYLVKTDAKGNILWSRTYGSARDDMGSCVQQTTDGGYIIAGYTWPSGAPDTDVYLVKTNAKGDTLWTRNYGILLDMHTESDQGYSVQQTSDGGYIIAGQKYHSVLSGNTLYTFPAVYLIKTDSTGDTLWTRTYGGKNMDVGKSIYQTSDRGYIVVGWTESFGSGGRDVYLIKTDELGNVTIK